MTNNEKVEFQALLFIERVHHKMEPSITSEEQIAAALVLGELVRKGEALCVLAGKGTGPIFSITPKGRQRLLDMA